jgi:hypothetical protein
MGFEEIIGFNGELRLVEQMREGIGVPLRGLVKNSSERLKVIRDFPKMAFCTEIDIIAERQGKFSEEEVYYTQLRWPSHALAYEESGILLSGNDNRATFLLPDGKICEARVVNSSEVVSSGVPRIGDLPLREDASEIPLGKYVEFAWKAIDQVKKASQGKSVGNQRLSDWLQSGWIAMYKGL